MILEVYIDETGTGNEERFMLAAFVARLGKWRSFEQEWSKLLQSKSISRSHAMEIHRRSGDFKYWNQVLKQQYFDEAAKLTQKFIQFGVTVSLDKKEYVEMYRATMPQKTPIDSEYGLCFRYLAQYIPELITDYFPEKYPEIHFICESGGKGSASIHQIMDDLKSFTPLNKALRTVKFKNKSEAAGLQISDIMAFSGRRMEHKANFEKIDPLRLADLRKSKESAALCPVFGEKLSPSNFSELQRQSQAIAREKRRIKIALKQANRKS